MESNGGVQGVDRQVRLVKDGEDYLPNIDAQQHSAPGVVPRVCMCSASGIFSRVYWTRVPAYRYVRTEQT